MKNALRDEFKVPSLLAVNGNETIALKADKNGALLISSGGDGSGDSGSLKLKKVINLDLAQSRDKILIEESFKEITIPVIEGKFTLFLDTPTQDKGMTITRAMSISTSGERFYISNGSGKGLAELWIWE